MALFIPALGKPREVKPKNETYFTINELYILLNCDCVQMIALANGRYLWVDEEAKLNGTLPVRNDMATQLLREAGGHPEDEVIGSALMANRVESGFEVEEEMP